MRHTLKIERSGDHAHLSHKDFDLLFPDHQIAPAKKSKDLSIPGEYVIDQKVSLIAKKGEIPLTIILPVREYSVVEISISQALRLGLKDLPIQLTSEPHLSEQFVVLRHAGRQVASHAIIHRPHLHVPYELEIADKVDLEIEGEYLKSVLFQVPAKKVKNLNDCILHVDNDTFNGLHTINIGLEFNAYLKV